MHDSKKTAGIAAVLLLTSAAIMLLPGPSAAAQKKILILHSYHQTSDWTDSIMQGMMAVLSDSQMNIDIHVEYMDTERHPPEDLFDNLEEFYRAKYEDVAFDIIILSDDNAFDFILPRRGRLFPGVPIVFCGINDFKKEKIQGVTDITGVNQEVDIKGTIALALRLEPGLRKFLVINDRTATGLANRKKYELDITAFEDETLSFELMEDFTLAELGTRLDALDQNSAVLVMSFHQTRDAIRYSPRDYFKFLKDRCGVPVFTLWASDVDAGALGGVVVSEKAQGSLATHYALRILQGEAASSLPVEMKSPNATLINYLQLKRFGIFEKNVPSDAALLFKPESIFDKYRYEILSAILVVGVLVVIIIVLFANIVIRKKTQKALLESEEKLSNALEMAHLGHWEYDTAKNVFQFNDQFYAIFHTTAQEVGGYTMTPDEYARRFVHPDDMHIVGEEIRKAVSATDPRYNRKIEHRMRYANGTTGYLAVSLFIMKDDQGRIVRLCGVAQDITELRQAEESILKSEERWRMILQTAMDGFCLSNMDMRVVEVNDAFCRITGYSREELLGKHLSDLEAIEKPEEMERHIQKIIEQGEDRFETKHRRKDGSLIDLEISTQYRPLEGGLLASFHRDITDRKQIEARLQHGQKMEAIGTLAGGIAHDFNNILQPMLGFCELLKDDLPADSALQGFVDGIHDAALRAKELVNQILSFSRQAAEEAKPTKLQPIIKEAMKLLRSSIPKTIDIEPDIDPECGIVFADPTQIYQIVMNLCTNAYQAMENEGGALKVVLQQIHLGGYNPIFPELRPGDYALLKVSDTGVGIPRPLLSRIFEPYFTTKDKTRGTGLGLSIVQSIVRRYSGDIRIYSEPGKGTEVHVYLPVMEKTEDMAAAAESGVLPGGGERILLVDDERPVAEMIHQMLERLNYRVTTHIGALEALETFGSNPDDFDLVITDLTMPHMTGIQLAGEITNIRENIPIILCTGFSEQTRNDSLASVGIRAKLAKPVIMKALAEIVCEVLSAVKRQP